MLALWAADKVAQNKVEQAILEDNRKLSSGLHRQKELIPSIGYQLGTLIEELKNGKPADEAIRQIEVLHKELGQIHEEQIINDRSEGMAAQFKGTGVELLDGQLNRYIQEAAGKYMDFDIMVSAPIDGAMKEYGLKQAELHILVGDLVRNAFRAVEKKDEGTGKIFYCSGFLRPGVYEIDVYDDGVEFPLEVMKNFGRRGVTTGGTGNGMADILETLAKYKASLRLTEYRPLTNEHTKCLSLVFDGMGEVSVESYRYQLLESLGLPDYVLLIAPLDEL